VVEERLRVQLSSLKKASQSVVVEVIDILIKRKERENFFEKDIETFFLSR
tara:strand:- start:812 stop:961 length:150 start_codon:yes stop_codon:yes gene_type:complete